MKTQKISINQLRSKIFDMATILVERYGIKTGIVLAPETLQKNKDRERLESMYESIYNILLSKMAVSFIKDEEFKDDKLNKKLTAKMIKNRRGYTTVIDQFKKRIAKCLHKWCKDIKVEMSGTHSVDLYISNKPLTQNFHDNLPEHMKLGILFFPTRDSLEMKVNYDITSTSNMGEGSDNHYAAQLIDLAHVLIHNKLVAKRMYDIYLMHESKKQSINDKDTELYMQLIRHFEEIAEKRLSEIGF